jgi:hypothetical protein
MRFAALDSSFPGATFIFGRTLVAGLRNMVKKPPKEKVFGKPVFFSFILVEIYINR